jgi:UDP-N-acetylglucosamine 2-epimerase
MLDLCCARLDDAARRAPDLLATLGVEPGRYVVLTVHRASNTDDRARLATILASFDTLDLPVLFPLHPRTRAALRDIRVPERVRAIAPVSYVDMLAIVRHALVVATDSGGVQKEAFFLGTPCLTLRDRTEWPETVEAGCNRLVDADVAAIRSAVRSCTRRPSASATAVFGDGHAGERIADLLDAWR